ncbi:class I SAM-dependent methyltransferase [Aminobacter anthyllidis]|uniref:class I SAM-dependent methyltransferase n=1 Tax=Aminobacter anthyllidis TaxID=1035067 RepID=UPI002454C6D3|nr:class I SAM-dependent methyltransferase [Aminobacter anthyllidis]MDH4984435.1 class I SAM-dependent methyltransferase [Aminobacter anthyllidis]
MRTTESGFDAYRTTYSEAVDDAVSFSGLKADYFIRAKAERLVGLLRSTLGDPQALSVLDVGCGIGTYQPILAGRIGKVSGVDPSVECIAEARQRNPQFDYRAYDGVTLPHGDNEFDACYAICVMHHVPTKMWSNFTSELARVTRKDGLVMLFEHNPCNPLTRRAVSNCPFDADATLLSMKTAFQYFRTSGLKEIEGRYILTIPSITGLVRRVDDLFWRLPIGAQYHVTGRP